jgi:hypothetical protein
MKTSELTGVALDWAVAMSEGFQSVYTNGSLLPVFRKCEAVENTIRCYSTDWAQGGTIIEREGITVQCEEVGVWSAYFREFLFEGDGTDRFSEGPTPLIAAMRCFVASKLGDEVDIPKELENV